METKNILIVGGLLIVAYLVYKNEQAKANAMVFIPNIVQGDTTAEQLRQAGLIAGSNILSSGVNAVSNIVDSALRTLTSNISNGTAPNTSGIYHPTETNSGTWATTSW